MASHRRLRWLPWAFAFAVALSVAYWSTLPPGLGTRESLNILFVGVEGVVTVESAPAVPEETRPKASAIMLMSLHPARRTAHLLLLPGEIPVPPDDDDPLAQYDDDRFLLELVDGVGAASLQQAVENLLNVPVHHTVRLDVLSLAQLVNRIGGLTIMPPPLPDAHGAVAAQAHTLSGEGLVEYVGLDAHPDGASRLAAQAAVFTAGLRALRSPTRMVHFESLFEVGVRYFETDMEQRKLFAVARHLYEVPEERIQLEVVPGGFQGHAYVIDQAAVRTLVTRVYDNKERP